MSSFINKYPYTDFHELNADYLLARLKAVEDEIANIEESIKEELSEWLKEQLAPYEETLEQLIQEVNDLSEQTAETLAEYDQKITDFINTVKNELASIRQELIDSIQAVNDLTDLKIEQNNIYLLNEITQNVGDLFVVQNPFTGGIVTIQEMIDYLSAFHITDAITYTEMANRALTYNQFNALNITYTDLTLHGDTLYQ